MMLYIMESVMTRIPLVMIFIFHCEMKTFVPVSMKYFILIF